MNIRNNELLIPSYASAFDESDGQPIIDASHSMASVWVSWNKEIDDKKLLPSDAIDRTGTVGNTKRTMDLHFPVCKPWEAYLSKALYGYDLKNS